MSRTLSLFEAGFAAAAGQAQAGRTAAARTTLNTLLANPALTAGEAVRAHTAAAALAHSAERYRRARRHLRKAAELHPHDAAIQYDLGRAFEDDPFGCDRRAARRYRKASQLNATEPKYRAALGRAMVRIRETASGVRVLCRAAAAAPTDTEVLEIVADGLREAGRAELAFRVLSKARFLAPADSGIRNLWTRAKFDLAAEDQRYDRPANVTRPQEVVPFLRLHGERPTADDRNTRRDLGHRPITAHIGRLRAYRSDHG